MNRSDFYAENQPAMRARSQTEADNFYSSLLASDVNYGLAPEVSTVHEVRLAFVGYEYVGNGDHIARIRARLY